MSDDSRPIKKTIPTRRAPAPAHKGQVAFRLTPDQEEFLQLEAYRLSARPPFAAVTVSDIMRLLIKERMALGNTPEHKARRCTVVAQGGQSFCVACLQRWTDENPSNCPDDGVPA